MKFYAHPILAMAALFLLAACGDDPETITSNGENITGGWFRGCLVDGSDGATMTRTYSGGGLTWFLDGWLEDTACNGASDYTLSGSTSITFAGTKTVSGVTVSKFDFTDNASVRTPNNTGAATTFAANSAYGIVDWASGVGQSVLGTDITGTAEAIAGKDIIYVNTAASPNTLQFGVEGTDGGAVDGNNYPETLDTTETFTKS